MIIIDVEQGSPDWHAYRCGRVTASRVADVMAKTKSGWGASRANYAAELIAERLTGVPATGFTSPAMQWGVDTEPKARLVYAMVQDVEVQKVGIVQHPTLSMSCASPDGLVGDDGMVEIKCPTVATHIETLLGEAVPGKYVLQMQWQMACAERKWCDFVSYDPRLPGEMQLFVRRVPFDPEVARDLAANIGQFLAEIDDKIERLVAKYGIKDAA